MVYNNDGNGIGLGTADYNIVQGNYVYSNGGYGIELDEYTEYCLVDGNYIYDNTAGAINDVDGGNTIINNIGYITRHDYISSQAISGGTYIGNIITTTGRISSSTGLYADWISGNSTNLTVTQGGTLTANLDGDSYTYGLDNMDFISSQAISGGTIKGTWAGDALTSAYITDYIASANVVANYVTSSTATARFADSSQYSTDKSTYATIVNTVASSTALANFAHSTNINSRFVASGVRLTSVSSQTISGGRILTNNLGVGTVSPSDIFSVAATSTQNAYFFYDNDDVHNDVDGQHLYIYRRAGEGDSYWDIWNDKWMQPNLDAYLDGVKYPVFTAEDSRISIARTSKSIQYFAYGDATQSIYQYGQIGGVDKFVNWFLNDATDNYELSSQNDINISFDIQMPTKTTSLSSQAISGGTIKGTTLTMAGRISSATGVYADFISGNATNLTVTQGGTLTADLDGDSYTYGAVDFGYVSSTTISGGTIKGTWAGDALTSAYITGYIASANAVAGFVASGVRLNAISSASISGGTIIGGLHYPADYIIYKDDSTYYAKKGDTGEVVSSDTNATVVMNFATNSLKSTGGSVKVNSGTYTVSGDTFVYGNTWFHGDGYSTKFGGFGGPTGIHGGVGGGKQGGNRFWLSGSNIDVGDFYGTGSVRVWIKKSDENIHNVRISNIMLSGVWVSGLVNSQAPLGCFLGEVGDNKTMSDIIFENCYVFSSVNSSGFELREEYGASNTTTAKRITFNNCVANKIGISPNAQSNWLVGFTINEGGLTCNNVYFNNCVTEDTWESGFHQETTPPVVNVMYNNCTARRNGSLKKYNYLNNINQIIQRSGTSTPDGATYGSNFFSCFSGNTYINCVGEDAALYFSNGVGGKFINCKIIGSGQYSNTQRGIRIYGNNSRDRNSVSIDNCEFSDLLSGAVYVAFASGLRIINNKFYNCVKRPNNDATIINVDAGCGNGQITNNTIINVSSSGLPDKIIDYGIGGNPQSNIIISENVLKGVNTNAIKLLAINNALITNNIIISSTSGYNQGISLGAACDYCTIARNRIRDWAGNCIYVYSDYVTIKDNEIYNSGFAGQGGAHNVIQYAIDDVAGKGGIVFIDRGRYQYVLYKIVHLVGHNIYQQCHQNNY